MGGEKKSVAIYFTSHNLFYPDKLECFENTIFEKDRYEWTRMRIQRATKHIFLRDVFKIWYTKGINAKICSIPLLVDFLKKEVEGFDEIIMVGSSAGGTAATLIGAMLNADIILNFNGQWEINSSIDKHDIKMLKDIRKDYGRFFDISKIIENTNNIFYFISEKSQWDHEQYIYTRHLAINRIFFKTSHHGIPFLKVAIPVVLNMSRNELSSLTSHHYNPLFFTFKCVGLKQTIRGLYNQVIKNTALNLYLIVCKSITYSKKYL